MRTFKMLLLFAVLSCPVAYALDSYDEVCNDIRSGDARQLATFFGSSVDLTVANQEDVYSKAQAEFVFRDFFKANPPNEFSITHQGSSKGGQPYAIGQYKSGSDTYRVFMKIKTFGNQLLVHEISFVKE